MYPNSRIEKAHFLVYSNEVQPFGANSDYYCDSALRAGFDSATHYTESMLRQTPFWEQNRAILEQSRGAGYWLWKPYIILEKLRQVGPNDIVIYNDAGRYKVGSFEPFPAFPHAAAELTALMPKRFILGTRIEWLVQGQFTKRDCMILTGADTDEMRYAPQMNACPALFMPSEASFAFLERWLELACDPRILTDQPDELAKPYPEFEDHRHDMAIASILLHQMRGHYFDLSDTGCLAEADALRRRNRHVPRLQTHIGYLSLIAQEALRDDFFADPQPDLAETMRLIRNVDPAEPVPQQPRTVTQKVLLEELAQWSGEALHQITPDHLRAAAARNPVTAMKIHALSQVDADTTPIWTQGTAAFVAARQADGYAAAMTRQASAALAAALDHHPEIMHAVLAEMAWSAFDDDSRALFKARFKNQRNPRGRAAMARFADHLAHQGLLNFQTEQAGRRKQVVQQINQAFASWPDQITSGADT